MTFSGHRTCFTQHLKTTALLCCSVSRPDKIIFPPPNWSPSQSLREEQDIGPELQHVYEVQRDSAGPILLSPRKTFCTSLTKSQNNLSAPVGKQRPQLGRPVHIRGEMSYDGPGLSAALPSGGVHRGATQLRLQTHLQCTETQGEDVPDNTHTHRPKPSGLLLAININASVFVYAAPVSGSRWSLISEVQH